MTQKGGHLSEEAKEKVRLSQLISWRDTDRRTKPIHRLPHSEQTKKNISEGLKGHTFTSETKIKISNTLKGQVVKPETRQKISIALKTKIASGKYTPIMPTPQKGKKLPQETLNKMSISMKARWKEPEFRERSHNSKLKMWQNDAYKQSRSGYNSHFWKGGKSFLIYPSKWDASFRANIRQRDSYICQLCHRQFSPSQHELSVHHIDYDKHNCTHINLITLCKKCHGLSNVDRPYWKDYFTNLMINRFNPDRII